MGIFDSFYLKNIKCPFCGEITEEMEFQTKQFECLLQGWKQGELFISRLLKINDGLIKDVYGGCCKPKCKAYVKRRDGYWGGFGRNIYCDVKIRKGIVIGAENIRKKE